MTTNNYTEEQLVEALRSKSRQGYEILYKYFAPVLLGLAKKITRSETAAEDILQDSFIKLWEKADEYSPERQAFTWFSNIVKNKSIDYLRSKHVKYKIQNPDDTVHYNELLKTEIAVDHIGLIEVINKMKPEHKLVLETVYYGCRTHEEASEELQIPLGTVKTRIRSAIIHLRESLKIRPGGY
ncbi:MAG: RNA polymerase sigma factor [Bacteroidetes bacterium]|nr:RNA polymerase sigma factor [Bacteroidota bacterium]